jgi:hypothetical protein
MFIQFSVAFKHAPLLLLLCFPGAVYSQHAAIDGSKNPELIPDSTASRLILLSLSLPLHPVPTDIVKRSYRMKRMGLTPFDSDTLSSLLNDFSSAYANWQSTFRSKSSFESVADRNHLVNSFLLLIERKLSPDGVARFRQYVQTEKSKISIPQ